MSGVQFIVMQTLFLCAIFILGARWPSVHPDLKARASPRPHADAL